MSPLDLVEILAVFANRLTADRKYPIQDCENLQLPIKNQLSEKRKIFLNFFFHFWKIRQILNIFKKRMIVIANVFPKLETAKVLLRPLSK